MKHIVCTCATCVNAGKPKPFTTGQGAIVLKLMDDGAIWDVYHLARHGWGIQFCSEDQKEWLALRPKLTKILSRLWKSGAIVKTSRGHYSLPVNGAIIEHRKTVR